MCIHSLYVCWQAVLYILKKIISSSFGFSEEMTLFPNYMSNREWNAHHEVLTAKEGNGYRHGVI